MALLRISLDWIAPEKDLGEVYFVQIERIGAIKIGWAKDANKRFYSLQSGSPYPLRVLYISSGHTKQDEKNVHILFDKYKMRGEWFHPDEKIFNYIDHCKEFDEHAEIKHREKMASRSYFDTQTGDWLDNAEETLGEHLRRTNGI